MAYNVLLNPVQTLSTGGAGAQTIDYTAAHLPDDQQPFFIAIYNSGGSNTYLVRTGETTSGVVAASGESVTAGPFLIDQAVDLELYFDAAGKAEVSFLSVLSEGV